MIVVDEVGPKMTLKRAVLLIKQPAGNFANSSHPYVSLLSLTRLQAPNALSISHRIPNTNGEVAGEKIEEV